MNRLLVILMAAYAASLLAALSAGVTIVVPWAFVLLLIVVAIPFAYAMAVLGGLLEPARARAPALARCLALALGVALVFVLRPRNVAFLVACGLFGLAFVWHGRRRSSAGGSPLLRATAVLCLGYASVWTLNYLIALVTAGRLQDQILRDVDLLVYRRLFGTTTQYAALFPLVRVPLLVERLENAYVLSSPSYFRWCWRCPAIPANCAGSFRPSSPVTSSARSSSCSFPRSVPASRIPSRSIAPTGRR
jgi:hypothetical protein